MSAYTHLQVFPTNLNISLSGPDLASLTSALQTALRQKVSTVTISNPTVRITSNSFNTTCSFSCPFQWLNITAAWDLHDNPPRINNIARYNMTWKSAPVTDDLKAAGTAYNTVGDNYLLTPLTTFIDFTPQPGRTTMSVQINGIPSSKIIYQNQTSQLAVFDSSRFQDPLEKWARTTNPNTRTQTWTSTRKGGFTASAIEQITEAGETANVAYIASGQISATISAPGTATARGDILFVDYSGGLMEELELAIIIASAGALAATTILDRRLSSRTEPRRKLKPRR